MENGGSFVREEEAGKNGKTKTVISNKPKNSLNIIHEIGLAVLL